jgi:hypothetical protein
MSDDPFEQPERRPAYSWKGAKVGTVLDSTVVEAPKEVQSREFETGELAYWDEKKEQPKMSVVVGVKTADGEEYSLWCPKPSAIFRAVAEAQKTAGDDVRIEEGGRLRVKLSGRKPDPKRPKLNPQNLFKAKYDPPEPPDAFAETPEVAEEPGDGNDGGFEEDNTPF